jgi:Holliday junction resolvase RusA-like endonuclease
MNVDLDRALAMSAALCANTNSLQFLVIPGAPYSKSRPRFSRNGSVYVKVEDRVQEERTAVFLKQKFRQPMTGNVALGCIFYRPNRQRIDADNMLKHVCDAANGVAYLDDSQVTAVMATVELDADNPRTVIIIGEHATSMTRGTDATKPCEHCGNPITLIGRKTAKRFCNAECTTAHRGQLLAEPVPCKHCEKPFKRATRAQTMCSPQCRADYLRDRRRGKAAPRSKCEDCQKTLTHTRGGRCRDCWRTARSAGVA